MQMHFTTLVKHTKKVFQGPFPCAMGDKWSLPGVVWCWVAVPFLMCSSVGTLGCSCPHSTDVPAISSFHGRDPQAPP